MQQELIKMVAERTGLPEDKAERAAETVIGYLKQQLPEPLSSQLDSFAGGGGTSGGALGDMTSRLGDLGKTGR